MQELWITAIIMRTMDVKHARVPQDSRGTMPGEVGFNRRRRRIDQRRSRYSGDGVIMAADDG